MQKQFLQMDPPSPRSPSPLLVEDLKVPDVAGGKVTVVLIAEETGEFK